MVTSLRNNSSTKTRSKYQARTTKAYLVYWPGFDSQNAGSTVTQDLTLLIAIVGNRSPWPRENTSLTSMALILRNAVAVSCGHMCSRICICIGRTEPRKDRCTTKGIPSVRVSPYLHDLLSDTPWQADCVNFSQSDTAERFATLATIWYPVSSFPTFFFFLLSLSLFLSLSFSLFFFS